MRELFHSDGDGKASVAKKAPSSSPSASHGGTKRSGGMTARSSSDDEVKIVVVEPSDSKQPSEKSAKSSPAPAPAQKCSFESAEGMCLLSISLGFV